ncbi:tRNA pseudouridine synthase, putative [Babesia bigemina]|uniref:tRNA pseudouridine(55) synthase n=1 Tax=Babesia bigemina TaxID=5866 RepID=A0A061DAG3_BABBI|nr:tRNA pseudouridine synthase, putative [Babesia bigemina]CDR96967.1 tRNA pseudouridine synthase, putative [Babesia bigemina]|eukprot:XP_012769153.1 tRNA pseudouridine synthase, putative [Babesia bigemina]
MTVAVLLQCVVVVASAVASGFGLRPLRPQPPPISGILNLYKSPGMTSNDACQIVKRILTDGLRERMATPRRPKIKVGHGGTLDMHAEGVLAIGVGSATKLLSFYLKGSKTYEATGVLGYETNTLDSHGETVKEAPWQHVTDADLDSAIQSMQGPYDQVPPLYSCRLGSWAINHETAKKHCGRSLRDYAIRSLPVEVKSSLVTVHSIERIRVPGAELPRFALRVTGSGGTYVRSLIRDIAYKLNTLGTLQSLVRTAKCDLTVDDALRIDSLDYDTIVQNLRTQNLS